MIIQRPPQWPFAVNWRSPQARYMTRWFPVLPFERDAKLRDLSANRQHVTTVNDAPTIVGSSLHKMPVLSFDGTNDYISIGTLSSIGTSSEACWSCWFRPLLADYGTAGNPWDLKSIISDADGYLGLVIGNFNSGGHKIHTYNNNQLVSSLSTFEQYGWYHALFAHSNGILYLYIDGILQGTNASGATGSTSAQVRVGHGWGGYANIEVRDIRVYSTLPHPLAIRQMFNPRTRYDLYRMADYHIGYVAGGTSYTIQANAGAYVYTGAAVNTFYNRLVVAAAGSYAWVGTVAGLLKGRTIAADGGTYGLTGSVASLVATRLIGAAAGSYAVTGSTVSLLYKRLITALSGTYALTGTAIATSINRVIQLASGAYSLVGSAVSLVYSAAPVLADVFDYINVLRRRRK